MSYVFNVNFYDRIAQIQQSLDRLFEGRPRTIRQAAQAMCVAEEAGEFLKCARHHLELSRKPKTEENWASMKEELADVVIAAVCAAELFGIDLDDEIVAKLDKIDARGGC